MYPNLRVLNATIRECIKPGGDVVGRACKYRPEQFPDVAAEDHRIGYRLPGNRPQRPSTGITQSEKDWGYAKRALARGEAPAAVIDAIATHRRYDKPNPQYHAELTVCKAAEALPVSVAPGEGAKVAAPQGARLPLVDGSERFRS